MRHRGSGGSRSGSRLLGAALRCAAAGALSLALGCGQAQVDACDDPRTAELTCVNAQIAWQDSASQAVREGQIDQLVILVSGDWVGHSETTSASSFQLPASVAVALPPYFPGPGRGDGAVRIEVEARLQGAVRGRGQIPVLGLRTGEHRSVPLALAPAGSS